MVLASLCPTRACFPASRRSFAVWLDASAKKKKHSELIAPASASERRPCESKANRPDERQVRTLEGDADTRQSERRRRKPTESQTTLVGWHKFEGGWSHGFII